MRKEDLVGGLQSSLWVKALSHSRSAHCRYSTNNHLAHMYRRHLKGFKQLVFGLTRDHGIVERIYDLLWNPPAQRISRPLLSPDPELMQLRHDAGSGWRSPRSPLDDDARHAYLP